MVGYTDNNYRGAQLSRLYRLQDKYGARLDVFNKNKENLTETRENSGRDNSLLKLNFIYLLVGLIVCLSVFYVVMGGSFFSLFVGPLVYLFWISYDRSKQLLIQKKFVAEYPAVMLATASNLKAGLSVYSALERAVQLLEKDSLVKIEVVSLLDKVSRGVKKEEAVGDFAKNVNLPEIRLFRRAFLMVLTSGGKFSRTLERLSEVCRDRESLIQSSKVSTASMRMTGNVLLGIAPFLLFMLSVRTKDFWPTLLYNPTASKLATVGLIVILSAYYILRRLSDFKP